MTLKEYIDSLNEFLNENPGAENLEVIYSSDDEGNNYHKVHFTPTSAYTKNIDDYYLEVTSDIQDFDIPNCVIIN